MDGQPIEHKKANAGRYAANTWLLSEIEAMRHQEPEIVKHYRQVLVQRPPKCCHTCYHYTQGGLCDKYDTQPPEDFAATPDQCEQWEDEIPF